MRKRIKNDLINIFKEVDGVMTFYSEHIHFNGELPLEVITDYIINKMKEAKNDPTPLEPKQS